MCILNTIHNPQSVLVKKTFTEFQSKKVLIECRKRLEPADTEPTAVSFILPVQMESAGLSQMSIEATRSSAKLARITQK